MYTRMGQFPFETGSLTRLLVLRATWKNNPIYRDMRDGRWKKKKKRREEKKQKNPPSSLTK